MSRPDPGATISLELYLAVVDELAKALRLLKGVSRSLEQDDRYPYTKTLIERFLANQVAEKED